MGEARRRGTYKQRKVEGEFYAAERARLDAWFRSKLPKPKHIDQRHDLTMAVLIVWASAQPAGKYLIR